MRFLHNPYFKVTVNGEIYANRTVKSVDVQLEENAYWRATVLLSNQPTQMFSVAHAGDDVTVEVSDSAESATWHKLFSGSILAPDEYVGTPKMLTLGCVGEGYALNMCNVAEEYGSQSRNPDLDTISEILTDATYGVVPKYVEKFLGGSDDTGYTIGTGNVETITGSIPYALSPYKPTDKFLCDLCDVVTALTAGSAGPHWIVDNDAELRVKTIGETQAGWHKYVGNSQADATLTDGVDFFNADWQHLGKQANCVVYYGMWRRPSSGDTWTYGSGWSIDSGLGTLALAQESSIFKVGTDSLKIYANGEDSSGSAWYPDDQAAAWDFSIFSEFNTPSLNFYARRSTDCNIADVSLYTDVAGSKYYNYTLYDGDPDDPLATADEWKHFSLPVGSYYNVDNQAQKWTPVNNPVGWGSIKCINFFVAATTSHALYIDGLHFGTVPICRVAREKFSGDGGSLGTAANPLRTKVITDNTGKDDSLTDGDDSGMMAQYAYAELLRLQKQSRTVKFTTKMAPHALPGQFVYIAGKDYRVTRLNHAFDAENGYRTAWEATDDLTNSRVRSRWEDQNKVWESVRPEWQDRQASSLKAGDVDIRVQRLTCAY